MTIETLHYAIQRFEALGAWYMADILRKLLNEELEEK